MIRDNVSTSTRIEWRRGGTITSRKLREKRSGHRGSILEVRVSGGPGGIWEPWGNGGGEGTRRRGQIAVGVARGLAYLHTGCRNCIIDCMGGYKGYSPYSQKYPTILAHFYVYMCIYLYMYMYNAIFCSIFTH